MRRDIRLSLSPCYVTGPGHPGADGSWNGIVTSVSSQTSARTSRAPKRWLAAWFPYLPADRVLRACSRQADLPLVLAEKVKGATRLAAVSRDAQAIGISQGMTLADARARIPDLWVEEADPVKEAVLL